MTSSAINARRPSDAMSCACSRPSPAWVTCSPGYSRNRRGSRSDSILAKTSFGVAMAVSTSPDTVTMRRPSTRLISE